MNMMDDPSCGEGPSGWLVILIIIVVLVFIFGGAYIMEEIL